MKTVIYSRFARARRVSLLFWVLLSTTAAGAFEPFFDDDASTRHAPPAPELTDFDLQVLTLCGDWGASVEARDFERMMLREQNRPVVERMRSALGSRIYGKAADLHEFVRQLRRVWFEQKGFQHVFCGEPGVGRDLGGFHYAARYWQAQEEGWAGYRPLPDDVRERPLEKCRVFHLRERIRPPVYSVGVEFRYPEGGTGAKCVSGYNHRMNAEHILIAATMAFKQANKRAGKYGSEACLFETRVGPVPAHYSKLVIRQRALRTFYPLADNRPYCRKDKRDFRACLCSRL